MADVQMQIVADLAEIKSSLKSLAKLVRKLNTAKDDPDGEKAKSRSTNNGFNRALEVSPKLREFLSLAQDELISRSEVTRRINAYVTSNNLKHPDNGRVIILDEKLTALLEPPSGIQITFLNIQKYLSPHYVKPAPSSPESVSPPSEPETPAVPPVSETPKVKRPVVKKTVKV
jgi:upstream activation factor subunit UAF30